MPTPSDLERCAVCDQLFDAAALDEVIYHAEGGCVREDAEKVQTGIRGMPLE